MNGFPYTTEAETECHLNLYGDLVSPNTQKIELYGLSYDSGRIAAAGLGVAKNPVSLNSTYNPCKPIRPCSHAFHAPLRETTKSGISRQESANMNHQLTMPTLRIGG